MKPFIDIILVHIDCSCSEMLIVLCNKKKNSTVVRFGENLSPTLLFMVNINNYTFHSYIKANYNLIAYSANENDLVMFK